MKLGQIMSGADATTTQVSCEMELGDLYRYGVQVTFSSNTTTGTLSLEGSVDNVGYVTIPSSAVTVSSGTTVVLYDNQQTGVRFIRLRWVPTVGSGTITAIFDIKEPANRF